MSLETPNASLGLHVLPEVGTLVDVQGTDLRRRSELLTSDDRERGLRIVERLQIVGRWHGRTPTQVALRWILEHRMVSVALTGAKTVSQITENAGGSGWSLPPEDVAFLQAPLSISCRAALADSS